MILDVNKRPIGIFDSGIGGLTVAHAVREVLPHENIVYFGDTARVPYGDKSAETIQHYSQEIVNFLLQKNCKLMLIACNSISAAATGMLRDYLPQSIPLMCVIDPVVEYVGEHFQHKKVGLIGTKQTVNSQVFANKIAALEMGVEFSALATPLLVPVIEEGFHHKTFIHEVLGEYLARPVLKDIDALILGCTHYPLVKPAINYYYQDKVELIDSSFVTANKLKNYLRHNHLLNNHAEPGEIQCYLSDLTEASLKSAAMFFGSEVQCELAKLS